MNVCMYERMYVHMYVRMYVCREYVHHCRNDCINLAMCMHVSLTRITTSAGVCCSCDAVCPPMVPRLDKGSAASISHSSVIVTMNCLVCSSFAFQVRELESNIDPLSLPFDRIDGGDHPPHAFPSFIHNLRVGSCISHRMPFLHSKSWPCMC